MFFWDILLDENALETWIADKLLYKKFILYPTNI